MKQAVTSKKGSIKFSTLLGMVAFCAMSSMAMAQDGAAAVQFDWIRVAYPIGLGMAAFGSALGLGRAVGSAMEAMGRQPEAAGKIQTTMIIGCAFIEALTIYALISIFLAG